MPWTRTFAAVNAKSEFVATMPTYQVIAVVATTTCLPSSNVPVSAVRNNELTYNEVIDGKAGASAGAEKKSPGTNHENARSGLACHASSGYPVEA